MKSLGSVILSSLLAFSAFLASAFEPEAGTGPERILDEVNVIALKQSEKLDDQPVSSTVVSHSELQTLNADAIKGISDVVPNFFVPDYGSRITSTMYVRGIGARMDQPAVGLYIDNVPFLNKNAYDFDVADIASVEMLRGPQSTLFGRNTIGGVINITTLSPRMFQGWKINLQGAMGNDWKLSAGWYHKFDDRTATSVNASFAYLGGFFRNKFNGRLLDHEIGGSLRWKIEHAASSRFRLSNVASLALHKQGGYPYEYVGTGEINYNDTCFYRRLVFSDGLTMKWRHEKFDMTSITGFQWLDDNMTLDQDFLPLPYFTLTQKQKEYSLTEDLVFKGKTGNSLYRWVAGAFGFYKHLAMEAPVTFKDKGISELIEKYRNDANPYYPIEWDTRQFPLLSDFTIPTGGVSLYHESDINLGRWRLSAGIRFDWERAVLDYLSRCDTGYEVLKLEDDGSYSSFRHVDVDINERGEVKRDFFNWMPKISVLYELPMEGENNVFATVTKGYKAGGFNTQMFSDVLKQRLMRIMGIGALYDIDDIVGYKPEYSWNYEVGAHLQFPRARLDIDLSAFYIDCRDQQLTMFPDGTTTGRIMTNAGKTRSIGCEVAANWEPVANLRLKASYGYTNARFVSFFDGIDDFAGNYLPYVPQNTIFGQAQYDFLFSGSFVKRLSVEMNVRGAGRIFWNEENSLSQDLYALLGASVTLDCRNVSLQVWGKNLADKNYYTFYFLSMGNEFLQRGRPVQIGATLRLSF